MAMTQDWGRLCKALAPTSAASTQSDEILTSKNSAIDYLSVLTDNLQDVQTVPTQSGQWLMEPLSSHFSSSLFSLSLADDRVCMAETKIIINVTMINGDFMIIRFARGLPR